MVVVFGIAGGLDFVKDLVFNVELVVVRVRVQTVSFNLETTIRGEAVTYSF